MWCQPVPIIAWLQLSLWWLRWFCVGVTLGSCRNQMSGLMTRTNGVQTWEKWSSSSYEFRTFTWSSGTSSVLVIEMWLLFSLTIIVSAYMERGDPGQTPHGQCSFQGIVCTTRQKNVSIILILAAQEETCLSLHSDWLRQGLLNGFCTYESIGR